MTSRVTLRPIPGFDPRKVTLPNYAAMPLEGLAMEVARLRLEAKAISASLDEDRRNGNPRGHDWRRDMGRRRTSLSYHATAAERVYFHKRKRSKATA